MHTAELLFRQQRGAATDEGINAIWGVIAALERNGQVADREPSVAAARGGYRAVVALPEAGSLRPTLFSRQVRREMRALSRHGIRLRDVRVLGGDPESAATCKCRTPRSFILETAALITEPPVRCGACRGVVPVYRLPFTSEHNDYDDVRYWMRRYRCLDELWLMSGVGEQFAYRELSRCDSDLSWMGRGICRRIEKRTGVPAYYYLYKYYGRSIAAEQKRTCPGCGRKWLLKESWHALYDFRCERCRLVSNIGWNVR
jgi:predicted  nucleic acid-binding Zn ribbon protein